MSDISVHFSEKTTGLLASIASREERSVPDLVQELAMEALEMREDLYWSKLVAELDKEGVKTYTHDEAWQ